VAVMYAGKIVESAPAAPLLASPRHPYTQGLLASTPDLEAPAGESFRPISGAPPASGDRLSGCPFHPRCPSAMPVCEAEMPGPTVLGETTVRCHLYGPGGES